MRYFPQKVHNAEHYINAAMRHAEYKQFDGAAVWAHIPL